MKQWHCPSCQAILAKDKGDGEGVFRCPDCFASWYMLQCRKSKIEAIGEAIAKVHKGEHS